TVELEPDACPAGFRLHVAYNASFDDWAALSEGAYLLRSNITDLHDEQLWKGYIQLPQAEAAFRIQKDQLNVRPIWHQRSERVQAHILCASSLSCCGRAWRCGSSAPGLATPHGRYSKSSHEFSRTTSCCRQLPTIRSGCAASHNPTPPSPPSLLNNNFGRSRRSATRGTGKIPLSIASARWLCALRGDWASQRR